MQEKRPRTSMLSLSVDTIHRKVIPPQEEHGNFPSISGKMKKWQELAQQFNHEIFLCTNARRGRSAHHQPLQKMGGKSFQLKQTPTQTTNTIHVPRPTTSNKQFMKPRTSITFERYRNSQKNKPNLKRSSRQYVDTKANVQYDRMVLKIGSNMQHEQKFNMYYIENIRKVQIIEPTPMPIVYGIKSETESYNACMTSFQNEQMPICISLFTESFHAKYQESIKRKKAYLDNTIKIMNGTYDPEIMSRMPIIHKKKQFDSKQYFTVLPKFKVSINYEQKQLIQKLIFRVKTEKLSKYEKKHLQLSRLQKQAIQSYKEALAITNLDYYLKDPQNLAHLPLRQYLSSQKEYISSFRIFYHGGYSKFLYSGWNGYYKHGQTQLPKKVFKLSEKVQKVNGWIQMFSHMIFIEDKLFDILLAPVSIDQMSAIQQSKITDSLNIFRNLCIKGVLTILTYSRYLLTRNDQHEQITKCATKYDYLIATDNDDKTLHSVSPNSQNQLINWYQYQLQNRHITKTLDDITDLTEVPIIRSEQLSQSQQRQINKSINILLNIFYQQLITRSITKFINFFLYSIKPCIKLNLIVDRQSLKLQEPEDNIIHTFTSILNKLTQERINCSSMGLRVQYPSSTDIFKEYGNLIMDDICTQTTRTSSAWTVNLDYKGMDIQSGRITNFLTQVRDWYHEAQGVIQHFACFMPFIKLTAKQKIFSQDLQQLEGLSQWQQAKQLYLNNQSKVLIYKNKLAQTPKKFAIGIFQVDCSEPQAILRDRISQLQYLFQQKYLSKVFGKIHEMQQELGRILSLIHSFNIKINRVQDIIDQLQQSKQQIHKIKTRTKQLASHIYFFIDKAKSTILINRFAQLINKRCELYVQIQELKIRVRQDSMELECKRQEQRILFRNKIVSYGDKLTYFCRQYFQLNKWDKYMILLTNMHTQLTQFHKQFNQLKDPNCTYEQQQQLYNTISNKIQIVYRHWANVSNFNLIVKQFDLQKIREIDLDRYEKIVQDSLGSIRDFQVLDLEINQINLVYLVRFKAEVDKHKSCLESIKILANKDIGLEYYTLFECILLLNIPFRDLLNLPSWNTYKPILQQLQIKAKAQQEMYSKYCSIKQRLQSQKLIIIDLHGCDTLDPDLTNQLAEVLRQQQFQCERLLLSEYSQKYRGKIEELWDMMIKCEKIVIKWLQVENKYIQLQAYYKYNDDGYFKESFKRIADFHRKIIKSFDMDNSVVLLPANSFLLTSLDTLLEKMGVLKKDLYRKFNQLQSSTCRLQLLTHDELLEMMSFVKTIPKHLPKCLPSISNFGLGEQAIERVGGYSTQEQSGKNQTIIGNYINLKEPINLNLRLANISVWLEKLLSDIKFVMKSQFLQTDRKQNCLQIMQLKEQLYFTEDIEDILSSQGDQTKKLQMSLEALQSRIEQKAKRSSQKYNTQMLLLVLMMERDILSSLIQNQQSCLLTKDSFEWIKNARFYNLHPQAPKKANKFELNIKMQVIAESYSYNFMFIEKCEMIIQDVLFVGNCIVGQKGIGKKAIVKHYAYMTGNQLFIFERDRISPNFTENVVNYYKLAITTGSWLLIPQVDVMSAEQMRTIGQCFNYLNHAIESKSTKMEIFVYNQFAVNDNCKVFFTLENFNCISTRLAHYFRPIWLCAPSLQFIGLVCNEVANMVDNKLKRANGENINFTFKIIDFIHWNHCHEDIPLYLPQSMLQQFEKPTKPCQHYLQNNFLNLLIHNKFLLPQDIGPPLLIEDNIQWMLENCTFSIFYLPKKDFINFLSNNFSQDTYVVLCLQSRNFGKMRQSFNYLRRRVRKAQIRYLFLEESLDNYKMIEGQMKDELFKQNNIKVIFLQNIDNLQNQAGIRIQAHFPTVIIPTPKPKSANSQNMPKFKKIGFKGFSLNQEQNLQLDTLCKKIVDNLIDNYLKNIVSTQQVTEILRWFNKLYTRLVKSKYCKQVSFIFTLGWVFGNVIPQKSIIAQLNKFLDEFKCKKFLKYCQNLRELYPKRHQFVAGCTLMQQKHQIKYKEGDLSFKCIIFSNLKLIRETLNDEAVSIFSEGAIDQMVLTLLPSCIHLYPIDLTSPIVLKNILQHILKIETNENFPCFVVHFAERLSEQVLISLKKFIEKGELVYEEGDDLKTFKQRKCQFTFSSSLKIQDFNAFKIQILREDLMEIEINKLEGIKQSLKTSNFFDESIFKGLINYYRTNSNKIFWFQIPIRQVFKRCETKNDDDSKKFFLELLRYQLLALPSEKNKILNEITYCSSSVSFLKSDSTEYQVKMNNATQILKPIEQGLAQNQIEAKKNICKDIVVMNENFGPSPYWYDMLYKTYIAISGSHTILMGSVFTQRYYCLQTAAKILNVEIIPWNFQLITNGTSEIPVKKNILFISDKDIREGALNQLQSLISQENSTLNLCYYVVLKLNEQTPETENLYKTYPFLKKYFIHVNFLKNSKQDITKCINLVKTLKILENGENKHELSVLNDQDIPPELEVEKSVTQYFQAELNKNIGFLMGLLEFRRELQDKEFNKYRFYRNLTEQLFHSISLMGKEVDGFPSKMQLLENKSEQISKEKNEVEKKKQNLLQFIETLKKKLDYLNEGINQKSENVQKIKQKVNNYEKQSQGHFKKICMKIEAMGVQEHSKFKQTHDSEVSNHIYNLVSNLVKWQPGKLKKLPIAKLENLSRDKTFKWEKYRESIRKIQAAWKNAKKKNEKLGLIFLALLQWIEAIDNYHFKNVEEYEKLRITIEKIQKDIESQNRQIHILKQQLISKQQEIGQYEQFITKKQQGQNELRQFRQLMQVRQERIQIVLKAMTQKQQKIKISKDLAERLYFLPKIIMSKSINRMALNQYEDEYFIARQLFLKSTRQDEGRQITDRDLFKYDLPLFQNIFDDFETVLEIYTKYNLVDLDYDQVKLIQTVIASNHRVQIIEDMHDLIGTNLLEIMSNYLGYKQLNLCNARPDQLKKEIMQKAKSYSKIIVQMSRCGKQLQVAKLIQILVEGISSHENLRMILIFKKFDSYYQTDRFKEISDRKVTLTYRKYLKQYGKIVYENEINSQWELYQAFSSYNKLHKSLFQKFQKFLPENDQSFNNIMELIKNFDSARETKQIVFEAYDQYYQNLSAISLEFGSFYIFLKYIEGIDRLNPIQLFQEGSLLKNYQQVLKKVSAQMYGQDKNDKRAEVLQKFIIYFSNIINFTDEQQVNQYCMIATFLLQKPQKITPYMIIQILRKADKCTKPNQRVQCIIKQVTHSTVNLTTIDKMLAAKNLEQICEPWLEYLIFATSANCQHYFDSFLNKISDTRFEEVVQSIKNRSYSLDSHYYLSKAKLDFKNQFRITTCRQRACKFFWLIKVKKDHVQKFMEVLENRVNVLRQGLKLVTFFFNQSKREVNFERLMELSQKKMFVCIFNIGKQKNYLIDEVISYLQQKSKNINQLFKIFFITQETTLIKNREHIDYISFIPPSQQNCQQTLQKNTQNLIHKALKNVQNSGDIKKNLNIINSLQVIIQKCTNKMLICREKDTIHKFVLSQLLNPLVLGKEENAIKFIAEYFRFSKFSAQQILEFCKLKEPLLVFNSKETKVTKIEIPPNSLTKWVALYQKLGACTILQPIYKQILLEQIQQIIQNLIKGQPARTVINDMEIRNIAKYGWVKIENPDTLKFLLYKGVYKTLKNQPHEYNCEIISQLKLVCQNEEKKIQFKFSQFNTLFSAENIVKQIQLTIKVIEENNDQPLLDRTQIQYILEHFNMRVSLADEKETLGKLYLTFK